MSHPTRRRIIATGFATFATLPAAAAFAATGTGTHHTVEIHKHMFMPADLRIAPGDRVTFVNKDIAPHTVTSDSGLFDSGYLLLTGSATMTFTGRGAFPYFCEVHDEMHGSITVA